jgi:hypothetical protein
MNKINILICSLLSCLPCAVSGQTSMSLRDGNVLTANARKAKPYCSHNWKQEVLHGGVIRTKAADGRRTGNHYLVLEPGLSSLLRMDFVNGYTVGPELTLGYVRQNQSRIELDANVEYGFSRRAWMGEGALRYVATPAQDSWIEVFGGRRTTDFDSEPLMDKAQQSIAVGLFGWNGHKLYEASKIGVRGRWWVARDLWIKGGVWYEGRREMTNHRKTNSFGIHPDINVPVCYDMPVQYGYTTVSTSHPWRPSDDYPTISVGPVENFHVVPLFNWERNPFLHWEEDHLWRADLAFEYTPKSTLVVKDDMRNEVKSTKPTMRFAFTSAWDAGSHQWGGKSVSYNACDWNGGFRYLSFDFSIEQRLKREKHRFSYYGSVGFFPVSDNVGLADYRHFDAAHFCWQNSLKNSLTWFSLLSNYESSTGNVWNELHGEYKYQHNDLLGQYVQLHLLHAPERPHMELSYGWQLEQQMRVGLSVGFDEIYQDFTFDGVGFNLIIEVK